MMGFAGKAPLGFALQAKENVMKAALPKPGHKFAFRLGHRDYGLILQDILDFVEYWLEDGYHLPGHQKVFFALENEKDPFISCLQWMVDRLGKSEKASCQQVVSSMKVYAISNLILSLGEEATRVNPLYKNVLVEEKLENVADCVILKGTYDYRRQIACGFHNTRNPSKKRDRCARSIVMRRMYILFEEFIPALKLDWIDRHDIRKLRKLVKAGNLKKGVLSFDGNL